jgi:outer membrane protein assembly factor BamB
MRPILLVTLYFGSLATGAVQADGNWPQFRGPGSRSISAEPGLPDTWSTTENVIWKVEVPGRGWSSPIVWSDRVIVTSVVSEGKLPVPKKGLYMGGEQKKPPTEVHRWMVYCFDLKTGKKLWEREAHKGVPATTVHVKSSYASETPVTDGERVYAYFGNIGVFCYDMDGKPLWSHPVEAQKTTFGWGPGASPALYKDRLIIVFDNEQQSYIEALAVHTGKTLWHVARDEKSNWATPVVWENSQRTEIITCGKKKIRSYDLEGHVLWEMGGMSSIVIPTPFSDAGLLYLSSGYVMDKNRPVFAVRPGASGDISLKKDEETNSFVVWSLKNAGPYNPSPLLYRDYFYVLKDGGVLSCYDAKTGKTLYTGQKLKGANSVTASPWAYDGKVFCLSEDGDTFVVQAGPEFKLLGKNSLGEMCLATPAIASGSLILRTQTQLYRIGSVPHAANPR